MLFPNQTSHMQMVEAQRCLENNNFTSATLCSECCGLFSKLNVFHKLWKEGKGGGGEREGEEMSRNSIGPSYGYKFMGKAKGERELIKNVSRIAV